jgi:hypothetical protein
MLPYSYRLICLRIRQLSRTSTRLGTNISRSPPIGLFPSLSLGRPFTSHPEMSPADRARRVTSVWPDYNSLSA